MVQQHLHVANLPEKLRKGLRNDDSSAVVLESLSPEGILTVTLNRSKQFNAMNDWMYLLLTEILDRATHSDQVKVVVLTGSGSKAFCAGADLNAGFDPMVGPLKSGKGSYHDPVGRFMTAVIAFQKPLIAAVNGISVGVGLTILPLCDMVFAAPSATFNSPFTVLAVTPEFCSSVTFPRLLGTSMASDMLLFGRKLNAEEAAKYRLVHEILPADNFLERVYERVRPSLGYVHADKSMRYFKGLMRTPRDVRELELVHRAEMSLLDERAIGANSQTAQAVVAMRAAASKAAQPPKPAGASAKAAAKL